jgi:hypothetical protein
MASSAGGAGVSPLLSLTALLSSLILVSLDPVESLLTSSEKAAPRDDAFQEGSSTTEPVKVRILKPVFCHFRALNLPVRSRLRRLALIAPAFALGPSFCAGVGAAKGVVELGSLIMSPSFCFLALGPGLPRGLGVLLPGVVVVPSTAEMPRFLEAGVFRLAPVVGGASDEGVLAPFMGVDCSAGVSADDSTIWGAAGVPGDDVGLGGGLAAAGSWGNARSALGDSLSTTVLDLLVLVDIFAMGGSTTRRARCSAWCWGQDATGGGGVGAGACLLGGAVLHARRVSGRRPCGWSRRRGRRSCKCSGRRAGGSRW